VRRLSQERVRFALVSDIAFESFPFQHVAPRVWDYVVRNFRPAEGVGWDVAPYEPYLYERSPAIEPTDIERKEVRSLMEPPLAPPPMFQTVAVDDWYSRDLELARWGSSYLEPSLIVRAPGGWRKVLVSFEVPAEKGYRFELACAITPWAWAGWVEGEGAIVEAWVTPSPEAGPPQRAWFRWLNPRKQPEDRRWHRAAVDLSSFVETPRAIVTLVVGSAPTFLATDASIAWSDLRLIVPEGESASSAESRIVRLGESSARRVLAFQPEDLAVFEQAVSQYPALGNAPAALADVAASLGRHERALTALQNAVRIDPDTSYYWMRLGQELQGAGRFAEAVEAMEAAIEREPDYSNYHAALASILLSQPGGLPRARDAALEALRIDRSDTWAWTILSSVERQAGNPEVAVRAAERSVALEPGNAWTHLGLAESLAAMGRTGEALESLDRAALLDMEPSARAALARNLLDCGKAERARQEALSAIEEERESKVAWIVLAHAESALGRWEPAVRAWREAIRLDPDNSSAWVQLSRTLAKSGLAREAFDALRAARDRANDDPSRLREVAVVLDELGHLEEASSAWQEVRRLAPEGPLKEEARRRLGYPALPAP
jgi:tetratricopeptide (TPR) repeat protein